MLTRCLINFEHPRETVKLATWGVRSQEWNSKELTGVRTSGGACGLIRWYARNLTWARMIQDMWWKSFSLRGLYQGAAWLSSARAVRCWVKSRNERNPYLQLPACNGGDSGETASARSEEGGDDVKSSWPLCPGLHTCYNGRYRGQRDGDVKQIPQNLSQFGLESATRLHEGGIASNRASAMARWIRSRTLYTPPVKPWKPRVPEDGDFTGSYLG